MKQRITDIQTQREHPSHQKLFLDGEPFGIIRSDLIEKFGLRIGLEIEAEAIERILAADEAMRAKNYALRLLREEIYSKSGIEQQLEREGFEAQAVQTAIVELIHSGHIRDRKYAENWVNRRQKSNPRGKTLLKHELVEKGIDLETAEQVVAEVDAEDEARLALEVAQKRAKHYKRLPIQVAKRRLHAYLARRGFESGMIRQIIEQVL